MSDQLGLYRFVPMVSASASASASASDIPTVPAELFAKFQISFYSEPVDAVFKALGVS